MFTYKLDEQGRQHWFTENGKPVCAATTSKGKHCMNHPVKGSNHCRFHGGNIKPILPYYSLIMPTNLYRELLAFAITAGYQFLTGIE